MTQLGLCETTWCISLLDVASWCTNWKDVASSHYPPSRWSPTHLAHGTMSGVRTLRAASWRNFFFPDGTSHARNRSRTLNRYTNFEGRKTLPPRGQLDYKKKKKKKKYLHAVRPENFLSSAEDANRVRGCYQVCFPSISGLEAGYTWRRGWWQTRFLLVGNRDIWRSVKQQWVWTNHRWPRRAG